MREIRFRGLHEGQDGKKRWVYGDLIHDMDGTVRIRTLQINGPVTYSVDPKTVGQMTGMVDHEGIDIFEGDILKEPDVTHNGEVQIEGRVYTASMSSGCWVAVSTICGMANYEWLKSTTVKGALVIGNIHENPELIGGE